MRHFIELLCFYKYIIVPKMCQSSTYLQPSQWSTRAHTESISLLYISWLWTFFNIVASRGFSALRISSPRHLPSFFSPSICSRGLTEFGVAARHVTVLVLQKQRATHCMAIIPWSVFVVRCCVGDCHGRTAVYICNRAVELHRFWIIRTVARSSETGLVSLWCPTKADCHRKKKIYILGASMFMFVFSSGVWNAYIIYVFIYSDSSLTKE